MLWLIAPKFLNDNSPLQLWIHLVENSYQWRPAINAIINLLVIQNAGNFLTSWVTVSFWIKTVLLGIRCSAKEMDLQSADLLSRESYQTSKWFIVSEVWIRSAHESWRRWYRKPNGVFIGNYIMLEVNRKFSWGDSDKWRPRNSK
jgi:hypothetical protein